jgi:uncharacterized protein YjbI with pentapeptide repeats
MKTFVVPLLSACLVVAGPGQRSDAQIPRAAEKATRTCPDKAPWTPTTWQLKHPKRANFCRADFSHWDLRHVELPDADLSDADLSGAHLEYADLSDANLAGAILSGAHLSHANFGGAHLNDAYLNAADLNHASLISANLDGANLGVANLNHADLSFADLIDADLSGAHLYGADLQTANLSGVRLEYNLLGSYEPGLLGSQETHLDGADLRYANLSGAHLSGAHLYGADLRNANLSGAHLRGAHLDDANLTEADLSEATLTGASLNGALLTSANVGHTQLAYADLTDAVYAPISPPTDTYVAGIKGLATLHIPSEQELGVIQLRKELQDAGLRDAERAATYSIERSGTTERFTSAPRLLREALGRAGFIDSTELYSSDNTARARLRLLQEALGGARFIDSTDVYSSDNTPPARFAWVEGLFRVVAFDMTTAYGMHPTRALVLIVVLGGILTLVYMWPILHSPGNSMKAGGIYQVFPADRMAETQDDLTAEKEPKWVRVETRDRWRAFRSAAYFSLISAVNIGFEQFTPGDWVRRLQAQNYSLEASGWVRVVAGTQALLSVFLLAMFVLTYFGRPFE